MTEVARVGARRLLAEAVEAEVSAFIAARADQVDEAGRRHNPRQSSTPQIIASLSVRFPLKD